MHFKFLLTIYFVRAQLAINFVTFLRTRVKIFTLVFRLDMSFQIFTVTVGFVTKLTFQFSPKCAHLLWSFKSLLLDLITPYILHLYVFFLFTNRSRRRKVFLSRRRDNIRKKWIFGRNICRCRCDCLFSLATFRKSLKLFLKFFSRELFTFLDDFGLTTESERSKISLEKCPMFLSWNLLNSMWEIYLVWNIMVLVIEGKNYTNCLLVNMF